LSESEARTISLVQSGAPGSGANFGSHSARRSAFPDDRWRTAFSTGRPLDRTRTPTADGRRAGRARPPSLRVCKPDCWHANLGEAPVSEGIPREAPFVFWRCTAPPPWASQRAPRSVGAHTVRGTEDGVILVALGSPEVAEPATTRCRRLTRRWPRCGARAPLGRIYVAI
jgi:hypothetical protein